MHPNGTRAVAKSLIYIFMWSSAGAAQQPPAPAPAAASSAPTEDIGWPRQVIKNGSTLVYYQPQVDEWKDYRELKAQVAFSLTPAGGKQTLGVASMHASTLVDKDTRTAFFRNLEVTSVRFPAMDPASAPAMEKLFRELIPSVGEPISVDRILADLDRSKVAAHPVALRNDPPQIFFSTNPAILLIVQGQAVLSPIEKTDLEFVVNTNWDLFFDKSTKHYYLLDAPGWLTAADLNGPWTHAAALPKDMEKLPAGQNWDDVKKNVPPQAGGAVPQVFSSNVPAELILVKGAPVYTKIPGTGLLYVANTDNDLFADPAENQYYVLLSGRWFRSKSFSGPWTYASNNLPADFAKIPSTSPKARVLASVPGTIEASDAVMLAQIPTTAIINRSDVEAAAKVTYDGKPEFKPIEGTPLHYATNTQDKVIQVGNQYYVCYNAVWLVSSVPTGPWKVADTIPKEIYSIPPSSPVYNVTYVTQTTTPTTVESSSTAGYLGMFIIGAAVGAAIVYGTGYYYPPYVYWGAGMIYPVYRPWPVTYGAAAVYNPWTGGFAAGHVAYGPYGAVGSAAWYNPATGRYGHAASVQGWYGGRTVASGYNPWTGAYGATSQGHNAYAQWGTSAAVRGNQWVQTGHVTTANGTVAGYRGSNGQGVMYRGQNGGTVARTGDTAYAGKDGNVYKREGGSWSKYDSGSWNPVDSGARPEQHSQSGRSRASVEPGTMQGLNQSWQSRERGQAQTQNFRNFRSGGGRFRR
jgi:hypothetical protein